MRPFLFAGICIAACTGCGPDSQVNSATVQWMEWPAEVLSRTPFTVRLVVWQAGCGFGAFRPGVSADQSAVTFSPYFLVEKQNAICLPEALVQDIAIGALDTAATAPGLAADYARSFEMRGSAEVFRAISAVVAPAADVPVRTFGDVTVRPATPDASRRNAAGTVVKTVDTQGCVRVMPVGLYRPGAALVLEDQADTTGLSYAFVRGYIHDAASAVCGQTRVFRLLSRN